MEKTDYKKQLKHLYGPSAKKVEIVDVPQMNFLMVDGEGDPSTSKSFDPCLIDFEILALRKGERLVEQAVREEPARSEQRPLSPRASYWH